MNTNANATTKTETLGKVEYELDAAGKRTGRWRPREGSSIQKLQGMSLAPVVQKWRPGRTAIEPTEAPKKK
jgi:hypothetical protein